METPPAPAPVVTTALAHDTGPSATDKITSDPALKGTSDPNALVTIKNGAAVLGTTTADATGKWSFAPAGLADGAYTRSASETDAAANSGSQLISFTLVPALGQIIKWLNPISGDWNTGANWDL